jgi:hypothetical protein
MRKAAKYFEMIGVPHEERVKIVVSMCKERLNIGGEASAAIDVFRGQHTIARERTEEQGRRRDRSGAPVRPVTYGLPNSSV